MLSVQPLPPEHLGAANEALDGLRSHPDGEIRLRITDASGQTEVTLPPELLPFLRTALGQLVNGQGLHLLPLQSELTTQEAAELLQLSRPHLVRLLDQGKIPFHMVGSHHRLKTADVIAYKTARDSRRSAALSALAQESQDLGLR